MARKNQYAENPHKPGTMVAAAWDTDESLRRLGRAFKKQPEAKWVDRQILKANAWLASKGL